MGEEVAEQRCAGGASSGVTCATSKQGSGLCVLRSGGTHFSNGIRTEQVALCIRKRTLLGPG